MITNNIDPLSTDPIPVIYQSGYLTIKGYDEQFRIYRLGFPNKEVGNGFMKYLLPFYTPVSANRTDSLIASFVMSLRNGEPEEFLSRLQAMYEAADYRIAGTMELYFQNSLFLVFHLMGFYADVERANARGRIDVLVKTDDYVYVIECKLDGSADEALQQIEEKGYTNQFANDSRKLYKIGVNFSSGTRGITEWKIKEND